MHVVSRSTGKVAYSGRGQLNRENEHLPVPFAPENLVSRDWFGRPVPRQPAHSPHQSSIINLVLTHGIPPDFRGGVHFFKPSYAIWSVSSFSGHAIAYRWRSLSRVRRHRASSPQGSSSNGCCLCITMDLLVCTSLFHTHYWYEVGMLKVSGAIHTTHTYYNQPYLYPAVS